MNSSLFRVKSREVNKTEKLRQAEPKVDRFYFLQSAKKTSTPVLSQFKLLTEK